ncbi:PEP-CTERM sorting domain-containing protein [Rubripirellula sp.]|nr:PEP-CTERM sorting domain-containing protein [Rubripirellula sp.]
MRQIHYGTLIAILLVLFSSTSEAAFLEYLSGSNSFTGSAGRAGTIYFAVYDNPEGSDWRSLSGLNGAGNNPDSVWGEAFTGKERSVFFFQYVRTDGTGAPTSEIFLPQGLDPYVKAGVYTRTVFDFGTNLQPNTLAGTSSNGTVPADELGVPDGFVNSNNAIESTFASTAGGDATFFYGNNLDGTDTTSIMVLASYNDIQAYPRTPFDVYSWDLAYKSTSIDGGSVFVPVPNPEPGSLALLALGFVGVSAVHRRKRCRRPV